MSSESRDEDPPPLATKASASCANAIVAQITVHSQELQRDGETVAQWMPRDSRTYRLLTHGHEVRGLRVLRYGGEAENRLKVPPKIKLIDMWLKESGHMFRALGRK
ncbi:hypothetical protein RB195_021133 [Necator americanus]|uniref:Uncharacterized protein n=1 Tax=Necator americanus TaxID=51031 RepID=A0ABR1E9K0_NECAM